MNHDLELTVTGTPIPQGSLSGYVIPKTKRVVIVNTNAKKLKPWRELITARAHTAAAHQGYTPHDGPLQADLTFYFDRPAYHFGTGRNARVLKPGAPTYVATKPDIDKLIRAVLDGLTDAEIWADDSRVAVLHVAQLYVQPGQAAGLLARVRPIVPVHHIDITDKMAELARTGPTSEETPTLFD